MTREFVEAVRRAAGGVMVSYAQNREDVLLARVLRDVAPGEGFYVDVGANDPVVDSVSFHFHLLGWSGVCVEPGEAVFPRLAELRGEGGRAACVAAACSDTDGGEVTFFEHPEATGTSTLSTEVDRGVAVLARGRYARKVRRRTVASILDEFAGLRAGRTIQFMSVDVEGHEREVLTGAELGRHRPRVLVVEAVAPNSNEARWERFEDVVTGAGYVPGYFDGVNRWYVREEDAATLLPRLARPVNAVDGYTTLEAATWKVRAEEANAALVLTRNHVTHVEGERSEAARRVEALSAELAAWKGTHGELSELELRRKEESEALRDRSDVLGGERERLGHALQAQRDHAAGLACGLEAERSRASGLTGRVAELESLVASLGTAAEAARTEREALAASLAGAEARAEEERGRTGAAVAEVNRLRGLVREADAHNERLADELKHFRHLHGQARAELDWILKGTGRRSLVVTLPVARAVHRAAKLLGLSGVPETQDARDGRHGGGNPSP